MREVGIHLEYVVVAVLDSPLETADVGGAEAELAGALYHEEALGELLLQFLDDGGGAVGRAVFDDEDIEGLLQTKDGADDVLNILFLVIRGDDNDAVALLHISKCVYFV